MAKLLFIFLFLFFNYIKRSAGKCHVTSITQSQLYDGYGKIVHRLCSSCISSVQKIKEDSIEFSIIRAPKRK